MDQELKTLLQDIYETVQYLKNKIELSDNNKEAYIKTNLIKIDDAAKITGYSKNYIYDLIHKKSIPFIKIGRSIRFDCEELEAWVRSGRPDIFAETINRLK